MKRYRQSTPSLPFREKSTDEFSFHSSHSSTSTATNTSTTTNSASRCER